MDYKRAHLIFWWGADGLKEEGRRREKLLSGGLGNTVEVFCKRSKRPGWRLRVGYICKRCYKLVTYARHNKRRKCVYCSKECYIQDNPKDNKYTRQEIQQRLAAQFFYLFAKAKLINYDEES